MCTIKTRKEQVLDIVINNPHAPTSEEKKIVLINQILSIYNGKTFHKKRGKTYGVQGVTKFDSQNLWESLYEYVMTMPYNLDLYDSMVVFGFLPRFHRGDIVRRRVNDRTERVEKIICDLWGSFSYETFEYGIKENPERNTGREAEFELDGTASDMEIILQGKSCDLIDQVSVTRIKRLFGQVLDEFDLPNGSYLDNNASGDWFVGYGMSNISAMVRSNKHDWDADAHRGEIRFHLTKTYKDEYSATLWWNYGPVYYEYHHDLFDRYNDETISRFVYADTPGEVLLKSAQMIRRVLKRFEAERVELQAQIQAKIDGHRTMSA